MEKSDKRVLFYVTMVVLLLLLLFASSFLSMAVLKHHGQDLSNEQLHSDTSGVNRALVAKVEQEKSILQSLTQIIFQIKKENFSNEKKKEKYLAVMDNMENHCDFEEIAISHVDKNGIMQTLGNEILEGDIANCEYYLKAMKNDGSTVLRTVKSKLDESKTYIVLVVPFFADFGEFGEPELGAKAQGVLRGAYSYEKWEASLAELVTNDSFFRVVDKNGDIIVTTSKDDKTYYENLGQHGRQVENIFEDIFSFGKENVQAQMLAGGTGFATLSTPLGSYAVCYEKLNFSGVWLNEWYVFSAIKSSYFTKLLDKPLKESIAIIVVMSLTITLLGIFVMYNISRNKKQLVESNLRLNNVIKYIGGGIFIYDIENNFKIIFANESAVTMYGYPLDEIKKFDVVQCLFEEDKAAYLKEIEKIKNEEITNFKIEYRIVRSDGTVCWMLENANVVMLDNKNRALQTIFVDINNQKKLEQELVIKEQNYKLAVKIMGVKVFEYNLQRKKIKVFEHDNLQDAYILQRELTIDELIASENPHQDDCAKLKQAFEKIDAGAPIADCIIRTYDQDGKETINKVSMTAIIVDGVTLRAVGSVDDITSEYNLEKEAKIKTVKDANKLLIYTANITRDFVVDGNTSTYNQQVTNARRKYSDIISIHKGEKIFVDDRREVYRKLNRSRLIDLYNSGVFSGDLEYRRMVDENVFHYVFTEFWLYKDDFTGDIMALFNIADIHTEYLNKVELMHNAEFDGLTGVYNRISAEQKIKAYLENKGNAELDVTFMIFDLDYFKSINDDFGHLAGDKALRDVAQTAYESFDDNSLVARVGGDEFAIFVFDINDRQKVRDCVGKFVSDVSKISMDKDAKKSISISLGLCFSKVAECEYGVLYERADDALMVAKRTGRNRFYEFGSTDFDDGIDKITGKMDFNSFKIKAKRLIEANPTANIVVLYSDIDNFKMINHIYGFAKGDELLRKYSDYLQSKASVNFARTNVDKFVGICLESTAEYEKIFYNMQYNDNLTSLLDLDYPVKRTLGAYKTNGDNFSKSIEEMIELAALASKELQTTSKRDWTVYDDGYIEKRAEENKYEASMEDALKNGEFLMYLQPQLSITENKATGCEALVRWQISEDEIVQPAGFIDLFEKNGFIRELDKYMFNSACQRIRKWIDSGKKPFSIAINVSQKDILSRTFISDYVEMKEKYNVPDGLLEVEFSESIIVENESLMINILEEFKKHGIRTAIDDFGAGCTSLNILNYACVDTLKIDKGFFVECHQCERKKLVVESIVKMAKVLGMSVVAEGIEKEKQIEFLRSIDCEYLQGYVIDKPLPVSEFENKYLQL